jgi:Ca-activated chloride channel family protein
VYAVGFLEHQTGSMRSQQKMQLMQMAETTGGQAFFPVSTRSLTDIFDKVVAQIRAQYSLGFTSRNARKDGTWRRIEVRLVGSHLQALKVRSRKGYFAPVLDPSSRGSGQ